MAESTQSKHHRNKVPAIPLFKGTRNLPEKELTIVKHYSTTVKGAMVSLVQDKLGLSLENLLLPSLAAVTHVVKRNYCERSDKNGGKNDFFRPKTRAPIETFKDQVQRHEDDIYLFVSLKKSLNSNNPSSTMDKAVLNSVKPAEEKT